MKICLISVEIFAWGKYGGFGRATRTIGKHLVERGHEVVAVVPRRDGQGPVERLDGMTVLSFPQKSWFESTQLLREADAEIYHSCEPSLGTWLAQRAMPDRVHVVTSRDPRDWEDWKTEFLLPSRSRFRVVANYIYENSPLVRRGVQRAEVLVERLRFEQRDHGVSRSLRKRFRSRSATPRMPPCANSAIETRRRPRPSCQAVG